MPSPPTPDAAPRAGLTLTVGLAWNTRIAGGSDSYGYVSQAHVWLAGGPPTAAPLALELRAMHVRDAAWVATPLGYRPGLRIGELAPTYPPGLPLLMAAAIAIFGAGGAFLISPLAGAVVVTCTYLLGRRVATPAGAACASALVATNPTFLSQLVQPMSDVPVTALWTACLVLACGTRPRRWVGAGVLAGLAVLVRPNLAPLAVMVAVAGACAAADERRATLRRLAGMTASIGVPAALAVAGILRLNVAWYGSATMSGYGTADQLFSLANVWPNVTRYGRTIVETNPVVVPLAAVAVAALVARRGVERPRFLAIALVAWCAAVAALYMPYISFPEWWYTRFLLPAYPAALVLAVAVLARAAAAWRLPRAVAAVVIACALAGGIWIARDRAVFDLKRLEARYEDVARRVDRLLPPSAVVLATQHSGTVRLYGQRPTLRADLLRPQDLDRVVERLADAGRPCFAVLDPHEREAFAARFSGARALVAPLFATRSGTVVLAITPAARTR